MDRRRGHTLPELVFTMAIVVGLLGWGIPSFQDLRRDAARTREVNQMVHAIHLARSEAIKRNGVVSLCPSADGSTCGPGGSVCAASVQQAANKANFTNRILRGYIIAGD